MIIQSTLYLYKIIKYNNYTLIEIFKDSNKIFTFNDSDFINSNLKNIFIRSYSNHKYYIDYNLGKILLTTRELKTKFLQPLLPIKKVNTNKIITIDTETINKNGVLVPYLYCMYDGSKSYSFFGNDPYKIREDLFRHLLRRKYRGYSIYAHNLSRFDIIFLFKYIAYLHNIEGYKVSPIIKDGDIISINIKNNKGINITFKDSYLLLEASLLSLSKTFNCRDLKGTEPILIENKSLSPEECYYTQDNFSHYSKDVKICNNFAEWREEIQDYCRKDCTVLHEVLSKFNELIYNKFLLRIEDYPTISSLSFAIYRRHYLPINKVPVTTGKVFDFIKDSYTGGSTDMFLPEGKNLYCYDVNSLYPFIMRNNLFPIGKINEFEGDINILKDIYWIGDVDITTKSDLQHPYLQIHYKMNGSYRTISPNGSFSMKIHKPEYLNSVKDYKITIKNGYFFKEDNIFKKFVDNLYALRMNYPKGDPMNYTCKLILNSLYGRFGMRPIITQQKFMMKNEFLELSSKYDIIEVLDLEDSGLFVIYEDEKLINKDHKVSVGIASAVTSYARSYMSRFKNNENYKLYYTDTDSIFIDTPLSNEEIGLDLGKFKLEYIFKEAVFLGPKIYAGITDNNEYISKVKGFKNAKSIVFNDFKSLLNKDKSLNLQHNKWYKFIDKSKIEIKEQMYNLIATENKRKLIRDENGKIIGSEAFKIN